MRILVLRGSLSLIYINLFLLFANYIIWRLQIHGQLEPSLKEVDVAYRNHSIYELIKQLPHYHGNKDGVKKWSRSKLKSAENHSTMFMKRASMKNLFKLKPEIKFSNIGKTKAIDCMRLIDGDPEELEKGKRFMDEHPKVPVHEETYLEWTKNCSKFKTDRSYVQVPLSAEEENFPLAFSISTYTDVEQTERLLRAIYQPQNLYCIHVDVKSSLLFHQAIRSIVGCFDNVWIASKLHKVKWGDVSVIMPEMSCMRDLLKYYRGQYKYFINLTGQEFPLRTIFELVYIAKIFNGSNDITGSSFRMEHDRVKYIWSHRWSKTYQQTILYNTGKLKEPYKYSNLTFFKGETHGFFSSEMTEYLVESKHGMSFLEWCKDTGHASEHYWNTLNYNALLNAPGGYTGDLHLADQYSIHPAIRAKNWVNLYEEQWPCYGKVVRGICIFGLKDTVWLAKRPEMFINKFHLTFEYLGYDCLEELHRNRTLSSSSLSFDQSYYESLPTVKYSRKHNFVPQSSQYEMLN